MLECITNYSTKSFILFLHSEKKTHNSIHSLIFNSRIPQNPCQKKKKKKKNRFTHQQGSIKITLCAAVKFNPTPPALRLTSNTSQLGSYLSASSALERSSRFMVPSRRSYRILCISKASSILYFVSAPHVDISVWDGSSKRVDSTTQLVKHTCPLGAK